MRIKVELTTDEVKSLINQEIENRINSDKLDVSKVKIEVKSKQNYKSEWEVADFRVTYEGDL
jgi:hypothetical protein